MATDKKKKNNKKETAKEVEIKKENKTVPVKEEKVVETEVVEEKEVTNEVKEEKVTADENNSKPNKKAELTEKEKKQMIKEEKKNANDRSPFQRVLNVVLWVICIAWMAISIYDYYNVNIKKKSDYKPVIVLTTKTVEFTEGKNNDKEAEAVEYYTLGFKFVKYTKGTCKGGIEFKAFFFKPRTDC